MDLEGPALSRSLDTVEDAAVDPAGNFYFTTNNNRDLIRRVTPGGRIEIFAGIPHPDCLSCSDGDNGPASAARIAPGFLAADGKGNLFLTEFTNAPTNNFVTHIRRISPDGTITRFAGYGAIPTSNTVDDEAKPALDILHIKIGGMSADTAGNLLLRSDAGTEFPHRPAHPPHRHQRHRQYHRRRTSFSAPSDGPPLQTAILSGTIAADTHGNVAFTESLSYPATTDAVREVTAQSTLTTLGGATPRPAPDGTPPAMHG